MVSEGLAGEGLQTGFSRHGLPPQIAPLDTVYPLRERLKSVQRMVSGGYCEGLFPDTVCWTRLRNTWNSSQRATSGVDLTLLTRVPKERAPESEKSPRTQLRTLFGHCAAHSLGTLGLPGAGGLGTPFWTLFGLFWGSGPEGPGRPLCQAGDFPRVLGSE